MWKASNAGYEFLCTKLYIVESHIGITHKRTTNITESSGSVNVETKHTTKPWKWEQMQDAVTAYPTRVSLHIALLCCFYNQQRCIKGQAGCYGGYNQNAGKNKSYAPVKSCALKIIPPFPVSCNVIQINNSKRLMQYSENRKVRQGGKCHAVKIWSPRTLRDCFGSWWGLWWHTVSNIPRNVSLHWSVIVILQEEW